MRETHRSSELNPIVLGSAIFLEKCGYNVNPTAENEAHFYRSLDSSQNYPRFHLILTFENQRVMTNFHLDQRTHRVILRPALVTEELERIIKVLTIEEGRPPIKDMLVSALRHNLLFGLSERIATYQERFKVPITRKFFAQRRRARLRKDVKASHLKQKYKEDIEDDF